MEEIVKLNPSEYGLEETKANDIANQFKPMLDKMVELEKEFNEVLKLDIENSETSKIAKELRLKYVKVRTGTATIHQQQKAFYLAGGRFVDGWKNAQVFASQGIEKRLEEIEKHFEIKEKKRIEELNVKRISMVSEYEVDGSNLNLGSMSDDVFATYIDGLKLQFEAKKEAERKAIEEQEKKQKLHDERRIEIMPFVSFLSPEYMWVNYAEMSTDEYANLLNEVKNKKQKHDQELRAQRIEKERLQKETEERQKQLDAERKERERVEAILKAEKEREAERLRQEQIELGNQRKEAEKLAKAPIKKQLKVWVDSFEINKTPIENDVSNSIIEKFELFKEWSINQIKNL